MVLLGVVLSHLHAYSINTFSDRLLLQKKIYLTQELNIDMGYNFSWYLKGPYCSALTSTIYEMIPEFSENEFLEYELTPEASVVLDKVNQLEFCAERSRTELEVAEWYELLASIEYLKNKSSWLSDKGKEGVCLKLRQEKPQFSSQQFNLAWDVLVREGLIKEAN